MSAPPTKEWLRAVAQHLNLSLSDLALRSGLAASTITRYVNDMSGQTGITQRSLEKIAEFSGVPQHVMPGQRRPAGLSEPDAVPLREGEIAAPSWLKAAIAEMRAASNALDPWIMKGWALDQAGILPGDILVVDLNRRPRAGDIVCAQLVDWTTGMTETVFRRFDPPFLTAHSGKLGPVRPEIVDDDRVSVRGVVVARIGLRH